MAVPLARVVSVAPVAVGQVAGLVDSLAAVRVAPQQDHPSIAVAQVDVDSGRLRGSRADDAGTWKNLSRRNSRPTPHQRRPFPKARSLLSEDQRREISAPN